jgi:hypothetical protein
MYVSMKKSVHFCVYKCHNVEKLVTLLIKPELDELVKPFNLSFAPLMKVGTTCHFKSNVGSLVNNPDWSFFSKKLVLRFRFESLKAT